MLQETIALHDVCQGRCARTGQPPDEVLLALARALLDTAGHASTKYTHLALLTTRSASGHGPCALRSHVGATTGW